MLLYINYMQTQSLNTKLLTRLTRFQSPAAALLRCFYSMLYESHYLRTKAKNAEQCNNASARPVLRFQHLLSKMLIWSSHGVSASVLGLTFA